MNNSRKYTFLTLIFLVCQIQYSQAQFGFGIGLVGGLPTGDFADIADFGGGLYLEPKYLINDRIAVGLNIRTLGFAGGELEAVAAGTVTIDSELSAFYVVPLTVFGDYFFVDSKVSPYVGLSFGPYFIGGGDLETEVQNGLQTGSAEFDFDPQTEFGFAPRVGVYIGKFNIGLSYNIADNFNFFDFRLGFDIGAKRNY